MKITSKKVEYRRILTVLRKSEGRTYFEISKGLELAEDQYKDGLLPTSRRGLRNLRNKKSGRAKSRIIDEYKEIILSALFNDPHIFGYLRNTWSLRSVARCLS